MQKRASGFTIVEMLVIAPMVVLAIGGFVVAIVSMTGAVIAGRAQTLMAYDVQSALSRIEADVRLSTSFLAKNSIALASPQGYNDDTTDFFNADTAKGDMLILEQPATSDNPLFFPTGYIYRQNQPNTCGSPFIRQNSRILTNIIYFVKDSTLWRRTVVPADYATASCTIPWQQPSCTPGYSDAFCKTNDIELVKGVSAHDFTVGYYSVSQPNTINEAAGDPQTPLATRTSLLKAATRANVSINATGLAAGREVTWSSSLRVMRAL